MDTCSNSRRKSWVDCFNAVGCQKQYSAVSIQKLQKSSDDSVSLDVANISFYEKDISFIQKKNSIPFGGPFQNCFELFFYVVEVTPISPTSAM